MSEITSSVEKPLPNLPLDVLKIAAQKILQLERDAEVALLEKGDSNEYKALLRAKADTLAGLPSQMEELTKRDIQVPDEVVTQTIDWSIQAKKMLETDNYFGISVLLIDRGSKIDEPNNLEKFINQLENPQVAK